MIKLLIVLSVFFYTTVGYATTALYRISSNEVYEISASNSTFPMKTNQFVAVAADVSVSDGMITVDPSGELRVFGYAKIKDGSTIRNATQPEIDGFGDAEIADLKQRQANIATEYFLSDDRIKRIVIAIVRGIVREDNKQRQWQRDLMDVVAASTSLANFKNRVAAMDTPVDREFSDAKDYIKDQITP